MESPSRWLPTGQAAQSLGVSMRTLKRYADTNHLLIEGKHWRFGPLANSPRQWNVDACTNALFYRGRLKKQVDSNSHVA